VHFICGSRIRQVVVHARGALVTRALELPDLPDEEVDLVVPEVAPLADPGSVRVRLVDTERQVVALQTALHVPEAPAPAGETVERVRDVGARLDRARAELARLASHRQALGELTPEPRLRRRQAPVAERIAAALATSAMIGAVLGDLDARLGELEEHVRDLERDLDAARLADAQASSQARMGQGHPTRRVTLRLAGAGPIGSAELSYVVPAARWWPVYTLRFVDGCKRVGWHLEALVAQRTGEDWSGVELELSTADLVADARLPELPSRRLGRAQPAPRRGYRPPPEGLERLFAGYDRAFAAPPPLPAPPAPDDAVDRLVAGGSFDSEEEVTRPGVEPASDDGRSTQPLRALAPTGFPAAAAAAPPPPIPARAATFAGTALGGLPAAPEPGAPSEPDDAWLDFDALTLAPPTDTVHRGRLRRGAAAVRARDPEAEIGELAPGPAVADVLSTRGQFDHAYRAASAGDVPADGLAHRVTVGLAETAPTLRYRTAPRADAAVYREAELVNPFPAPLLAGPVDVYVEGSLLVSTAIQHIDRGGRVSVGLGVEERIKVARNARFDESSGGLLGGATIVTTDVIIDLSSALGAAARVDVVDRVPLSDDKALEVEVAASSPPADEYSQSDRGAPMRGGLLWRVDLPAGGTARVSYQLRLTFSSKSEIVGGNRRD
jgi:hypothetical protein